MKRAKCLGMFFARPSAPVNVLETLGSAINRNLRLRTQTHKCVLKVKWKATSFSIFISISLLKIIASIIFVFFWAQKSVVSAAQFATIAHKKGFEIRFFHKRQHFYRVAKIFQRKNMFSNKARICKAREQHSCATTRKDSINQFETMRHRQDIRDVHESFPAVIFRPIPLRHRMSTV